MNTNLFVENLLQAKNQGVYPEECAGIIGQWYKSSNASGKIGLMEMADTISKNKETAAVWNKYGEGLADYFVEAVRLSELTKTMHSLRQI